MTTETKTASKTFASLDEFAEAALAAAGTDASYRLTEAVRMAGEGWTAKLDETLRLADEAIQLVDRETEVFRMADPVWDVAGDQVDVDAFLSGDPDNMVSWPLQPVSAVGKVITLCAGVSFSGAVSDETVIRRGMTVAALAQALSRLGHSTELWIDRTTTSHDGSRRTKIRVLVQAAGEVIDPARIVFAFANPSVLTGLAWAVDANWPRDYASAVQRMPTSPDQDLPEGTIYLPALRSTTDVPDAPEALKSYLSDLGLLATDE